MTCSKCGTSGWKGHNCPFCGTHHHGRPGKICSCGQYIETRDEIRTLERIDLEAELADFERYGEIWEARV